MCDKCAIGKRSYGKKSSIGAMDNLEDKALEGLEGVVAAGVGAIGALEIIKNVPATTLNSDIRDGIGAAVGAAAMIFTPAEYKTAGVALGAAVAGVFVMNAYMRHFAAPGIGKPNPVIGNKGKQYNPVIAKKPYNNASLSASLQVDRMLGI